MRNDLAHNNASMLLLTRYCCPRYCCPHTGAHPPVKKGVKGAMTLQTVSSTSNSAASASAVSAGPLRPLSRLRLYRTYTLVRESMKRTRYGTTVYRLRGGTQWKQQNGVQDEGCSWVAAKRADAAPLPAPPALCPMLLTGTPPSLPAQRP